MKDHHGPCDLYTEKDTLWFLWHACQKKCIPQSTYEKTSDKPKLKGVLQNSHKYSSKCKCRERFFKKSKTKDWLEIRGDQDRTNELKIVGILDQKKHICGNTGKISGKSLD